MTHARAPAVAGLFYPDAAHLLRREVERLLEGVPASASARPQALIVPHAGYIYSGPVAAQAYARLRPWREHIKRVVLLGPPHRVPIRGVSMCGASAFSTPLGPVAVDTLALTSLLHLPFVNVDDRAHAPEHALEVQLPFLQMVLAHFEIVPLLVADADVTHVGQVIDTWWAAADTLIVVSTDLSHYLDYAGAQARDRGTDAAIMRLDPAVIGPEQACGCRALNGLLHLARQRGAHIQRLMLCNSGDTAGARDAVVGYAAYAVH